MIVDWWSTHHRLQPMFGSIVPMFLLLTSTKRQIVADSTRDLCTSLCLIRAIRPIHASYWWHGTEISCKSYRSRALAKPQESTVLMLMLVLPLFSLCYSQLGELSCWDQYSSCSNSTPWFGRTLLACEQICGWRTTVYAQIFDR